MYDQCWLVNFRSGNCKGERLAAAVRAQARVIELDFSCLDEQLREAGRHEKIMVVGGDGTFASALTSPSVPDRPIGLVPIGTANDLARELGMMSLCSGKRYGDLPGILHPLNARNLATWDLLADQYVRGFCNYVSLGFEGAVVRDFDRWRSGSKVQNRHLNRLMYGLIGLRHLGHRVESITVTADDGSSVTCPSSRGIVISNIQSHMGIGIISRGCDSSDDLIECVRASSPLDYLQILASKFYLSPSLSALRRGKSFTLSGLASGTAIQIDGEPLRPLLGDRIEIRFKKFVRVLVGHPPANIGRP